MEPLGDEKGREENEKVFLLLLLLLLSSSFQSGLILSEFFSPRKYLAIPISPSDKKFVCPFPMLVLERAGIFRWRTTLKKIGHVSA